MWRLKIVNSLRAKNVYQLPTSVLVDNKTSHDIMKTACSQNSFQPCIYRFFSAFLVAIIYTSLVYIAPIHATSTCKNYFACAKHKVVTSNDPITRLFLIQMKMC